MGTADLVVNATPVGMAGGAPAGEWLVPPGLLGAGQVAADLVYAPRPTQWLDEAAATGATVLDGLGMLVHQAAAQPERAFSAADLAGPAGSAVTLTDGSVAEAVGAADLVVNATPVGMAGGAPAGEWLVPPGLLGAGQVAADLVYAPRPTRWLREAAATGATVLDGLGMLVHQAAAQLALWTGVEPPVAAMWRAAEAAAALPPEDVVGTTEP